jgi:hypothetical protein
MLKPSSGMPSPAKTVFRFSRSEIPVRHGEDSRPDCCYNRTSCSGAIRKRCQGSVHHGRRPYSRRPGPGCKRKDRDGVLLRASDTHTDITAVLSRLSLLDRCMVAQNRAVRRHHRHALPASYPPRACRRLWNFPLKVLVQISRKNSRSDAGDKLIRNRRSRGDPCVSLFAVVSWTRELLGSPSVIRRKPQPWERFPGGLSSYISSDVHPRSTGGVSNQQDGISSAPAPEVL